MIWTLANPWMLLGLAGAAIPIIIHLLNRRRNVVIEWGAMQFLEVGRKARRRIQLTDFLLMAARMLLLALVALALARPSLSIKKQPSQAALSGLAGQGLRRDVVFVLDGSDSMAMRAGQTTPRKQAILWAQRLLQRLPAGSTAALLEARDHVWERSVPLSLDRAGVAQSLSQCPEPRGSSDLAAGLTEALRLLDQAESPVRQVVILTDGQKHPWRVGETQRWQLLKALHEQQNTKSSSPPSLWVVNFGGKKSPSDADGSVGPVELARGLVPPGLPLLIRTVVANSGPGSLTRTAQLFVDGQAVPGLAQAVGPVPPGGQLPVQFRTVLDSVGSHLITVRLLASENDPLSANDEASRPVEVVSAVPLLLVDGEPDARPLLSESDFVHAALAPSGDEAPQVSARVVAPQDLTPESLEQTRVVVLGNLSQLSLPQQDALASFLGSGGGILVAPGDRSSAEAWNTQIFRDGLGWLPAELGEVRGDPAQRAIVAQPAPASFTGPVLSPLGQDEIPALSTADLYFYYALKPSTREPKASVLARLNTGDPWIVERPYRMGRVIMTAGPLDGEGGTLPVNPDFVPLMHELVYHLADRSDASATVRPGEVALIPVELEPSNSSDHLAVTTPSGSKVDAAIERSSAGTRARIAADEPGTYRLELPDGTVSYTVVQTDPREFDLAPLPAEDQKSLAEGWPLVFSADQQSAERDLLATGDERSNPLWRFLILAALFLLGFELLLTRRIARSRGIAQNADD